MFVACFFPESPLYPSTTKVIAWRPVDQCWTGHLATVSVILKNLEDISVVLSEISSPWVYRSEVRVEAIGLLQHIKEVFYLLDMQHTRYYYFLTHQTSSYRPRTWTYLLEWNLCAVPQSVYVSWDVTLYLLNSGMQLPTTTQLRNPAKEDVPWTGTLKSTCWGECGTKVRPIVDLAGHEMVESEYYVVTKGWRGLREEMDSSETIVKTKQNTQSTILTALQLALVFGTSTVTCENSFSTLKSVFTDRRNMLHARKARLVQGT